MCQIVIIINNSAQFEKLNICIVFYKTTRKQTTQILEFPSVYFTTYKVRDVFLKTPLFEKK